MDKDSKWLETTEPCRGAKGAKCLLYLSNIAARCSCFRIAVWLDKRHAKRIMKANNLGGLAMVSRKSK